MNNIKNIDINSIPNSLLKYENVKALGQIIADYLNGISADIDKAVIFPRIDELDESLLDILAYDLHIDWYDYDYNIEQKRSIIKTSVNVHRKLGTKYAVETALKAAYPNSKVIPWFENGGEPYNFDVQIDISKSDKPVGLDKVAAIVNYYKSLRDNVGKTEFTTAAERNVNIAIIPVTSKLETLNPLYEDIVAGCMFNVGLAGYLTCGRCEVIDAEVITPAPGDSGDIVGDYITLADGFVDEGIIGYIKPIIQESSVTLYRGGSYQFTVQEYASAVWSVSGNTDAGTIISESGLLSVAENESSTALTVTAAAIDGSCSDSISVAVDMGKVVFIMPAMTDNTTVVDGKTYVASASEEFNTTTKAYKPFDGTSSIGGTDCWHTGTAHPQWLQLQFPFKVILKKFTMKNRSANIEAPKDFILQGSDNGTDWTDLGNFVFSETQTAGVVKQFDVNYDYTDGFTYYRWYITTTVNGAHTVIAKIIFDEAFKEG